MSRGAGQACRCAEMARCLRVCACLPVCAHAGRARRRSERRRRPGRAARVWAPPDGPPAPAVPCWLDECAPGSAWDPSVRSRALGTAVLFPCSGLLRGPARLPWALCRPERSHTRRRAPRGTWVASVSGTGCFRGPSRAPSFPGLARILAVGSSRWWGRGWAVVPRRGPEPVSPAWQGPLTGWAQWGCLGRARLSAGGGARSAALSGRNKENSLRSACVCPQRLGDPW